MRIGIDAKWYYGGPPSGVRVIQSLVQALVDYDKTNEYVIFLDKKFKHKNFDTIKAPNVTLVFLWAENNLLSNVFVLPFKAKPYKLDVLVFQNFVSPFFRAKKIAYIFDVLFVSFPEFFTAKERIYFFFIKYFGWFADGIITLSKEEKKRLIQFGFAKESRIYPIYIGVDSTFKPLKDHDASVVRLVKEKFKLPDRFLLYVGRLNARKNIELLIKAMPQLNDQSIPLVVAGREDWKHSNYKELAEDLGVLDKIIFTGWTEEDELPIVYALATIFCFPSFAEGFGLPPLEAMASGVPVIVSNATSLPEICGGAAKYVSPQQPKEMTAAINSLIENQTDYAEKREQGVTHAKEFTWINTAKKFYETFVLTVD
jgi:glycosyltransferase involved in cell wall biosynthesis